MCQVCEDRARKIIEQSHWPLETSVSRAALVVLERVTRAVVPTCYPESSPALNAELENLANIIRAHLQHHPVKIVPIEEDWLA